MSLAFGKKDQKRKERNKKEKRKEKKKIKKERKKAVVNRKRLVMFWLGVLADCAFRTSAAMLLSLTREFDLAALEKSWRRWGAAGSVMSEYKTYSESQVTVYRGDQLLSFTSDHVKTLLQILPHDIAKTIKLCSFFFKF